jgi:hypothetical protein
MCLAARLKFAALILGNLMDPQRALHGSERRDRRIAQGLAWKGLDHEKQLA